MQTIDIEILKEAKRIATNRKRSLTRNVNNHNYPEDQLFQCPFCNYLPKGSKGTAKIFSKTKTFFCFACKEWRSFDNE